MKKSPEIKVAITDDHQIVIDGLSAALGNFGHINIVAAATTGPAILRFIAVNKPDVLITDVMMPGMDGMQLAQSVRTTFPGIRILALSMNGAGGQVESLVPFIDGYLLKQCGISELVTAIETVNQGGTYFDQSIQAERLRYKRSQQSVRDIGITPREKQIIRLLSKNLSNKDISGELFISVRTVETHRKNILYKTGTSNILSLMSWAQEHKML